MRIIKVTYLFLTLLLAFSSSLISQEFEDSDAHKNYLKEDYEIKKFDQKRWEEIRKGVSEGYSSDDFEWYEDSEGKSERLQDSDNPYTRSKREYREYRNTKKAERVKRLPKKEREAYREREQRRNNSTGSGIFSGFGTVIAILVILGFAALIFYLFFNAPIELPSKKISKDLESVIPTEIPKTELELLLDKALSKEDYREAIRIYFIFIIRGLIIKDWIVWEKEKTNFSYLIEMRNKPYSEEFETTVSVYEIVWYGERILTKEEYLSLEPRFKNLVKNLDK
ncbi:hypothetical protein N9488_00940 [Flavobacteriales bacterium]|jgi:hypothetical protein|nr:hypothetical protein [Flavobacteriales bacterium]|tara:strand:+ start:3019 stop:3861 length:843 start_codon:yes stop_codon:yes gene_type:complete